ncbi:Uncharacterised protein [Capnocytophaga canimorsus]|nr:Uncharacterised protein [Capnocytophaga canimorsus]
MVFIQFETIFFHFIDTYLLDADYLMLTCLLNCIIKV